MKTLLAGMMLAISVAPTIAAPYRTPVPATFESKGEDRQAIEGLLDNYTKAVSTKDQALFESLLLDKAIPFTGVPLLGKSGDLTVKTANYEDFRKGVFEGEPFTQNFEDIHIKQDGTLAQVSLVFVNTTSTDKSWGWKTMELVKVGGKWKIAAEFFTGHN
ncbi:hypothetical protein GCM10011611_47800 [Aliidongia dinghuensis]|uniref:DUF4440 domain-containing protein n=1 Tax=Aliidongia dinghuensis TaxID=1867774 RepID=A0A8J2YXF2_9PROT|nr:nuclear transport factor 2 family protein [Aliidongia dinghuensis]GGF35892.1 hypothetical protein GCM10011611_47800 [Aliidongia dinghuensis]